MPIRHVLVAVLVMAVWGTNFVSIQLALKDFSPLTLAALRFLFTAFPAVLFIPRPKVEFGTLVLYGFLTFGLQFALLFSGMQKGVSAGLTSMVLQVQVFFTIGLAAVFFGERPGFLKILAAVIAFSGIVLVGLHSGSEVNLVGLVLLLGASMSWALGNTIAKKLRAAHPLALVVWGGLAAWPFLFGMAVYQEGIPSWEKLATVTATTWWSLAYIVLLSTHLGYSLWSWLLQHYSASTVAPFTLLVPVFGYLSAAVFLGEQITDWKMHAALLVITGLAINIYVSRRASRKSHAP